MQLEFFLRSGKSQTITGIVRALLQVKRPIELTRQKSPSVASANVNSANDGRAVAHRHVVRGAEKGEDSHLLSVEWWLQRDRSSVDRRFRSQIDGSRSEENDSSVSIDAFAERNSSPLFFQFRSN